VHEPIVDRAVWERVQKKRGKARKRKTNDGEHNPFSGLLVCGDCGHNLHYHFSQANPDIHYFNCSNYKGNRGTCNATHYIRVDFLEQVVLGEIQRLTRFAAGYEEAFVKAVAGRSEEMMQEERKAKQKALNALLARDREIDTIIEHLYEDNITGKLTDERFVKMSRKYEAEQSELSSRIKSARAELEEVKDTGITTDHFLAAVRKYTRAKKLTPRMLNELIDHIEVYHAEKIDGVQVQRLRIHYNCVGVIEIPELLPIPETKVRMRTRKGVEVSYEKAG